MHFRQRVEKSCTVIEWTGDVDISCTPDAREQVLACLDEGAHVLIDASAVRHIDSSGIAVLIEGHTTALKCGCGFGLLAPSRAVTDVLKLARVDTILPIHASLEKLRQV